MPASSPASRRPAALRHAVALAVLAAALGVWHLAAPAVAVADAGGADASTAAAVDEILSDAALPSAVWGVLAVDAQTGRVVVSRGAGTLLLPASTLKLFTTATALDALGPDFRFTTGLYHLGTTAGSTLRGDLVIRGAADPTFGSDEMPGLGNPLSRWAEALYAAGVRRIEGRIVGDDDRTDDAPYPEGWDVTHIATEPYAPAIGGLAYADNLLGLRLDGGRVEASPAGFASIRRAPAGRAGGSRSGALTIRRALGSDEFTVAGTVPSREATVRLPVANPTRYAVHAFAARLAAAGIDVSQATLWDVDDLDEPPDYAGAEPLLVSVSPTLARIIEHTNKESDNLYAEHLLRALTPEGSAEAGVARVRAFLAEAGAPDADDLSLQDGSGLSRKDLITPASMVALLRHMRRHPASPAFMASLPTGGGAGSTLRNRLGGVPVRAKTGSISYARCLSGYVTGPDGETLAFTIMANNYTDEGARITGAMDGIVRALATGRRPDTAPGSEE
ncbi:MAG TPA: D-alanyl-D-alanine carboxypeptidase/D-alanyl-D-alanine-endopeptidase [Rubricoccaceae bacterium]|jgi:D-alanyl-D-alanine carboxypeptidase/D-alanyl-D-alanine-endopeptidase (penicillin-binding protein 4)